MLKISFHKMLWCMLILGIGGLAWAAGVTSDPLSGSATVGSIQIPLDLKSSTPVAGLNGEFQYDPAYFTNPTILAGPGASGFIVLGNLVSPGHYKFVIYSDPVKTLKLDTCVALFQVTAPKKLANSAITKITYGSTAASDASAKSLSTSLGSVQIKLSGNAANDWALYE